MNTIRIGYFTCGDAILNRFENRVTRRAGAALLPPVLAAAALVAPGVTEPAFASGPLDPTAIVSAAMSTAAPTPGAVPAVPSSASMTVEAAGVSLTVSGVDASSTPTVTVSGSPSAALPDAGSAAGEQGKGPAATLTAAAPQYHRAVTQYQAPVTVQPAAVSAPPTDVRVAVSGNGASPRPTAPRADPTTQAPDAAAAGGVRPTVARGSACDTTAVDTAISILGNLSGSIRAEVSGLICAAVPRVSVQMSGNIGPRSSTPVLGTLRPEGCSCAPARVDLGGARAHPVLPPSSATACCVQSGSLAGASQRAATTHAEPRAAASSRPKARGPDRGERGPPGPGRLPPLPLPAPAGMAAGGVGGGGLFGPVFMALVLWLLLQPPGISVLRLPAQIRSPKTLVDDRRDRPG